MQVGVLPEAAQPQGKGQKGTAAHTRSPQQLPGQTLHPDQLPADAHKWGSVERAPLRLLQLPLLNSTCSGLLALGGGGLAPGEASSSTAAQNLRGKLQGLRRLRSTFSFTRPIRFSQDCGKGLHHPCLCPAPREFSFWGRGEKNPCLACTRASLPASGPLSGCHPPISPLSTPQHPPARPE